MLGYFVCESTLRRMTRLALHALFMIITAANEGEGQQSQYFSDLHLQPFGV